MIQNLSEREFSMLFEISERVKRRTVEIEAWIDRQWQ